MYKPQIYPRQTRKSLKIGCAQMRWLPKVLTLVLAVAAASCAKNTVDAESIRVAVASNFAEPAKAIAAAFEKESGLRVKLAFGSTGKHYAQIIYGGTFDAFFGADVRRPKLLEEKGHALAGSRFTYAIGKVALWSPDENLVDDAAKVLSRGE